MQLFAWKLQSTASLYKVTWNVVSEVLTCKRNHFNGSFFVFISGFLFQRLAATCSVKRIQQSYKGVANIRTHLIISLNNCYTLNSDMTAFERYVVDMKPTLPSVESVEINP